MSEEERLAQVVQQMIDDHRDLAAISPAWVATQAMEVIEFPRGLHPLGYAGCHLELRQIARAKLRRQFDPTSREREDFEEDFFPETLQDRYPRRQNPDDEPVYIPRGLMSQSDIDYNVGRMRRAGYGLLKHAQALEEWGAAHLGGAA